MSLRNSITVLALIAACGPAAATPIQQSDIEDCKVFGQTASVIMELRQMGAKMSDLMKPEGEGAGLENSLIIEAFDTPQYQTEDAKKRAIRDFDNRIFGECAKQRGSAGHSQ